MHVSWWCGRRFPSSIPGSRSRVSSLNAPASLRSCSFERNGLSQQSLFRAGLFDLTPFSVSPELSSSRIAGCLSLSSLFKKFRHETISLSREALCR